jgi:predicted glutamine amidotransferase
MGATFSAMCELMGISFSRAVSAAISISEFAGRDAQNADGWGLAWYPDRSAAVVKEPISWRSSKHTHFLQSYSAIVSSIYIAHVRHKTVGGYATHADTHPFVRESAGRDYAFAHNGTVLGVADVLPLGRFRPIGHTDSEDAFCRLMAVVEAWPDGLRGRENWSRLHELFGIVNRCGKFNCLLSDGESLFCYFDENRHKGLAWRRFEIESNQTETFSDAEMKVEVEGRSPSYGVLVATHPLSGEGWTALEPGEMCVFAGGRLRFSSRHASVAAVRDGTADISGASG